MYCSYCTDQVKSSTMRERMAAARMISTLVSSPAEEAGQGADLLTSLVRASPPLTTRHLVSWCSAWCASPATSLLAPWPWLPTDSLDRKHLQRSGGHTEAGTWQLALGSAHLRIFTSRLSSHRQVMPSSYGAHRWTMAARPPGSDD